MLTELLLTFNIAPAEIILPEFNFTVWNEKLNSEVSLQRSCSRFQPS